MAGFLTPACVESQDSARLVKEQATVINEIAFNAGQSIVASVRFYLISTSLSILSQGILYSHKRRKACVRKVSKPTTFPE